MAHAIAKLTKTVKEKDMQIVSLINKVEAQVQNMGESSQRLNHLPNVTSHLDDAPHTYRIMQVERQTTESTSVASLSIQQLQDMITNTIGALTVDPHRVRSCTLNLTLRGLIVYVCL